MKCKDVAIVTKHQAQKRQQWTHLNRVDWMIRTAYHPKQNEGKSATCVAKVRDWLCHGL